MTNAGIDVRNDANNDDIKRRRYFMILKSQKGYSLIEIGVGIIIITVYLASSTTLFNGCFNTYRAIQQRNYVVNYAVSQVERMLQLDADILMPDPSNEELIDEVKSLNDTADGKEKLATGEYAVPADVVNGAFANSPDTNNMRIITKVRRIPSDGNYAYDNSVINISVVVEYTAMPQLDANNVNEEDILSYEIGAVKVTKK